MILTEKPEGEVVVRIWCVDRPQSARIIRLSNIFRIPAQVLQSSFGALLFAPGIDNFFVVDYWRGGSTEEDIDAGRFPFVCRLPGVWAQFPSGFLQIER